MADGTPIPLRVQRDELAVSDLMPTCPHCQRLCDPGSLYCCEDGTRLTLTFNEVQDLRKPVREERITR